jgi:hypothetical protein
MATLRPYDLNHRSSAVRRATSDRRQQYKLPVLECHRTAAVMPGPATPSGLQIIRYRSGASQGNIWHGYDFATLAYNTTTGAQLWLTRHNPALGSHDLPAQLAIVPGANRVAVTGSSQLLLCCSSY